MSTPDPENGNQGRRDFLTLLLGGSAAVALYETINTDPIGLAPQVGSLPNNAPPSILSQPSIHGDGWRVMGVLPGLAPNGIAPTAGWGDMPNLAMLSITGPGWSEDGQFIEAQQRLIRCNLGVKRMWELGKYQHNTVPEAPYVLDAMGNNLYFEFASTRFVYKGERATLTARDGWFLGASEVSASALPNNSNLPYAKAMIDWVEPPREQVVGQFKVRLTGGFHVEGRNGRPLAAVKVTGTPWDPVTNSARLTGAPVTRLAVYEWSGEANKPGRGSAVWAAEFAEADFSTPGLVRFTFEDCPWVGDTTAQRCNELLPSLNPRTTAFGFKGNTNTITSGTHGVFKWVGPIAPQRHVYVVASDSSLMFRGIDGSASCQSSKAAAKAAPFASFDAAWGALFDPKKGGNADASGAILWLSDGNHLLPANGLTGSAALKSATDLPVLIQSDPDSAFAADKCNLLTSGTVRCILFNHGRSTKTSFVSIRNISLIARKGMIGSIAGSGVKSPTYCHFDNCIVSDQTDGLSPILGSGIIVSGSRSAFRSVSKLSYMIFLSKGYIYNFFHNCESEMSVKANVVWGMAYPGQFWVSPVVLGTEPSGFLRNKNLIAGYVFVPDWRTAAKEAHTFVNRTTPGATDEDWGISVAYCRTAAERYNNTRFVKTGETITKNYKNLVIEAVTITRQADPLIYNSGGGGFNFHNDPQQFPTQPPGNDYDRCLVRNSYVARMAVKGDVFMSRRSPSAAIFMTGGRNVRHGVGMSGLIVGSAGDDNVLNIKGLCSIWNTSQTDYEMNYFDKAKSDFRPVSGFLPLPKDLIGHGYDLNGEKLFLDGSDAPGAFRRVVVA